MFIELYCFLLVRVQHLSLTWVDWHHTDSLWALFQRSIIEFRFGYPIFYLGTSGNFPPNTMQPEEVRSHVSQRHSDKQAMQQEINDLKRKLRHAQRRWSHSSPDMPSDDESDNNYRQRSRTPPSETFSYEEGHYRRRKRKSLSPRGLGNDAMSRALDQLSKSPFTRHIEGATLPRRFQQPTFTIYNSKIDPVEHVS